MKENKKQEPTQEKIRARGSSVDCIVSWFGRYKPRLSEYSLVMAVAICIVWFKLDSGIEDLSGWSHFFLGSMLYAWAKWVLSLFGIQDS